MISKEASRVVPRTDLKIWDISSISIFTPRNDLLLSTFPGPTPALIKIMRMYKPISIAILSHLKTHSIRPYNCSCEPKSQTVRTSS